MIAVTGGSGLVGQHLLAALTAVQPVRVLYRKTKPVFRLPVRDDRIEWIQGDVTDSGSLDAFCSGADKLYHLAGMVSYQPGDKEALMLQNATGTANLVNAALAHGVKKMVYLSSIAALGDEKNREVNENSTREPGESRTAYSISKWEAEKEVWRGVAEGLEAHPVQSVRSAML